jgi:adenylate cyclase
MTQDGPKRKLTAILSADVVGYSRLMDDNEEATIQTLNAYLASMSILIQQNSGRVVDTTGDNLLAEFASAVDALNCALKIQRELAEQNAGLPAERRMEFRIGVNVGDVVEEEDRIYGDGVNIAARLEKLAEAGGICISGTVYDHVENKLDLEYVFFGEKEIKNIKRPIRVYRVFPEPVTVSTDKNSGLLKTSDMPSIAVLPFVNLSGETEQEYFSDGVTEEIITGLSRVPNVFVIARNSTFIYKGKPVKVQRVSEELGVRYVLEGSIRKSGERVRITVQLIDATTGHHLWAERYDRELKDIFAIQDEISMKIMTALQVQLTEGEQARVFGKGTNNLDAFLKFLEGLHHYRLTGAFHMRLARKAFEEAIALDPKYAIAYRFLSGIHHMDVAYQTSKSPLQSIVLAKECAEKAVSLDDSLAEAHGYLGVCLLFENEYEKAVACAERGAELCPNSADVYQILGSVLTYADRLVEAKTMLKNALSLNPIPPSRYLYQLGYAYQNSGQFEEAMAEYKKALKLNPDWIFPYLGLTVCYIMLQREEDARAAAAEVLRINPKFSVTQWEIVLPFKNKERKRLELEALRKAGLK